MFCFKIWMRFLNMHNKNVLFDKWIKCREMIKLLRLNYSVLLFRLSQNPHVLSLTLKPVIWGVKNYKFKLLEILDLSDTLGSWIIGLALSVVSKYLFYFTKKNQQWSRRLILHKHTSLWKSWILSLLIIFSQNSEQMWL